MNIKAMNAVLGTILIAATIPALAKSMAGNEELMNRYPAGSIDSTEKADRALQETAAQRASIERQFAEEQAQCQQKFFVNACLDAVKESYREAGKELRSIEIEANTFQRKERVVERDQALADRAAQEEQERPARLKQEEENQAAAAQREADRASGQKPAVPPHTDERSAEHAAKVKKLHAEEEADAAKRAQNVADYQAKVKEAQEHQREVETRKREKEKEKASKDAASGSSTVAPTR